jgi:hypothetical protein
MPKPILKVGRKYKLPVNTDRGNLVNWQSHGRNAKGERVCRVRTTKKRSFLLTQAVGVCRIVASADLLRGAELMVLKSESRVVGKRSGR